MKKYIKTYRNLILTAQVDYLHGFHHLDTLGLNSGIWILFYMFNYVNFHSIRIFFHSWNRFFSKACNQMRWLFFSNWMKDTNSLSRIRYKFFPPPPPRRIHSPLRLYDLESTLEWVNLIGGRVSSVRNTKRPGEVVFFLRRFLEQKRSRKRNEIVGQKFTHGGSYIFLYF